MKKIFLFFLFASIVFGTELKIASFNVKNLFDDKTDGTEYKEFKIENLK